MKQALLTQRIVWGALMASVVIYGVVAYVLSTTNEPQPIDPTLRWALAAAAVFTAMASITLRRIKLPALAEEPSPYHRAAPVEAAPPEVLGELMTAYILTWALSEAVAVFGLVLAIISYTYEAYLPYALAALILQATNPPTQGRLEAAIRAAAD